MTSVVQKSSYRFTRESLPFWGTFFLMSFLYLVSTPPDRSSSLFFSGVGVIILLSGLFFDIGVPYCHKLKKDFIREHKKHRNRIVRRRLNVISRKVIGTIKQREEVLENGNGHLQVN